MKLSEQWLREYANPPGDTDSLVHQLTMQGLEVESVIPAGPDLSQVVVGRVHELEPHPNADRLRVCAVDIGGTIRQVVCGAANVRVGGSYPLALAGARLAGDLVIRPSRLRGVASDGMLCSAAELGLAERADGLLELDPGTTPGTPIAEALGLADRILDIKVTPNRADCFSVSGIARDLGAAAGVHFADVVVTPVAASSQDALPMRVEAPEDCPVLATRVVRGLRPDAVAPLWLRERLRRSGIRSIHPVVDVTNYVMLEIGQPMHAYDLATLSGGLTVRAGRPGETLNLLSGDAVELQPDALVIADERGPVALAGIMGGAPTAVSASTQDIVLESAFFRPGVIAGRARRYGLQTDSATRFERGVDPAGQLRAIERATDLLLGIAGGVPGPSVCIAAKAGPVRPVSLRRQRLADVLGDAVPDTEVRDILGRLGMRVESTPEGWSVQPPSFRFDISIEVDLIEEVGRIRGYERIPEVPARQDVRLGRAEGQRVSLDGARAMLVARGYQEAVTYSFVPEALDTALAGSRAALALLNPISTELAVMRQSLWPGLLTAVRHNLARQQRRVRLFETGVRFAMDPSGPVEESVIAGVAVGSAYPEQWNLPAEDTGFFDVKSDLEGMLRLGRRTADFAFAAAEHPALQPGRAARLLCDGMAVGWLGFLHPRLVTELDLPAAPVLFELAAEAVLKARVPHYRELSRFPSVRRDLALLVARDVPAASLRSAVAEAAGPALREIILFDIFAGERIETGQKSVALGLILQETSRTLNDTDVDQIVGGVAERLAKDFNARIRE